MIMVRAGAAALWLAAASSAQTEPSRVAGAPMVMAQAGFTFGARDDLGPRYDPYSERWDRYRPPQPVVCRWLSVRTAGAGGKMVVRKQRVCGVRVPART
jgi:hypothetical protein